MIATPLYTVITDPFTIHLIYIEEKACSPYVRVAPKTCMFKAKEDFKLPLDVILRVYSICVYPIGLHWMCFLPYSYKA